MSIESGFGRVLLMAIGLIAFLGFSGFGAWNSWSKYSHSKTWTPVDARLVALEMRCQVQVKRKQANSDNEKWYDEGGEKACSEIDSVARRTLFGAKRRVQETEYATFEYEAGGATQKRQMKRYDIASTSIAEGERFPIFVDPQNPGRIDRSLSWADILFSGGFILAGLFFLISTWAFPYMWSNSRRTKPSLEISTS